MTFNPVFPCPVCATGTVEIWPIRDFDRAGNPFEVLVPVVHCGCVTSPEQDAALRAQYRDAEDRFIDEQAYD